MAVMAITNDNGKRKTSISRILNQICQVMKFLKKNLTILLHKFIYGFLSASWESPKNSSSNKKANIKTNLYTYVYVS